MPYSTEYGCLIYSCSVLLRYIKLGVGGVRNIADSAMNIDLVFYRRWFCQLMYICILVSYEKTSSQYANLGFNVFFQESYQDLKGNNY